MKNLLTLMAAVAVAGIITTGCNGNDEPKNEPNDYVAITLDGAQTRTCESGNDFALNLLDAASRSTDGNVVLSPITVATNLAMLANGAKGETLDDILDVLGAGSLEELNSYYSMMAGRLPGMDRTVTLKFANSLWHSENLSVTQDFTASINRYFNAQVNGFTPGSNDAWEAINKWCADNTEGLIKRFLATPPTGNMYMLSATYFNGAWDLFDKDYSDKGTFRNEDGSTSDVTMMSTHRSKTLLYAETDNCGAVSLPYGNGAFMLTLILPEEGKTVREAINATEINSLLSSEQYRDLTVNLPRFEVGFRKALNDALGSLGFDPAQSGNDYTGIGNVDSDLVLMHETTLAVNEKGTTAAAVAGVQDPTSVLRPDGIFQVDRPFAFLIREKSTNAILFAGVIRNL